MVAESYHLGEPEVGVCLSFGLITIESAFLSLNSYKVKQSPSMWSCDFDEVGVGSESFLAEVVV